MLQLKQVLQIRGSEMVDKAYSIWTSSSGERNLKLASISRIIPGQKNLQGQSRDGDLDSWS